MPQAVDHRADIYSTGVVFYEMLARELPGRDRIPPSRKAATDPRLDPIVLRALEHERDRRYQEARLMHRDITELARTPESTIRIEKHVPAPPEEVFAVWVDPSRMSDWYAPSDDFGPTVGEFDPQVGGQYRVGMLLPGRTDPDTSPGNTAAGRTPDLELHLELGAPQARHLGDPGDRRVQSRGGGTDLVLTHERFRSEPDRDAHARVGEAASSVESEVRGLIIRG